MDIGEQGVSIYAAGEMPIISSSTSQQPISPHPPQAADDAVLDVTTSTCSCLNQPPSTLDALKTMPNASRPLETMVILSGKNCLVRGKGSATDSPWGTTAVRADWPDPIDTVEIDKEESRRLCWSVMMLVSTLREYTPHLQHQAWDMHITRQENVCRLF